MTCGGSVEDGWRYYFIHSLNEGEERGIGDLETSESEKVEEVKLDGWYWKKKT